MSFVSDMRDYCAVTNADVRALIKGPSILMDGDMIVKAGPCKGRLLVDDSTLITGHLKLKSIGGGLYPSHYLDFIDAVFGPEPNTIEVCARTVKVDNMYHLKVDNMHHPNIEVISGCRTRATVDIDPAFKPTYLCNAEKLNGVPSSFFARARADPPYNEKTAKEMYNCELPSFLKMLGAMSRVIEIGSLIFLLLGPTNFQMCPPSLRRVGLVTISLIPSNELRALNIYLKVKDDRPEEALQGW